MNSKQLAGIGVGVAALAGITMVFLNNASPYATVAEAKTMKGDNIHLYGELDKSSVQSSAAAKQVRFVIQDENKVMYSDLLRLHLCLKAN